MGFTAELASSVARQKSLLPEVTGSEWSNWET